MLPRRSSGHPGCAHMRTLFSLKFDCQLNTIESSKYFANAICQVHVGQWSCQEMLRKDIISRVAASVDVDRPGDGIRWLAIDDWFYLISQVKYTQEQKSNLPPLHNSIWIRANESHAQMPKCLSVNDSAVQRIIVRPKSVVPAAAAATSSNQIYTDRMWGYK